MRGGLKSTRLVLPTFPPNTAGGRRTLVLWAAAIEATNNRHILENGASMFTDGDLAYVRAVRDEAETTHGPPFTMLPYFWSLMLRAVTSEFYWPGATRAIIWPKEPPAPASTSADAATGTTRTNLE